MSHQQSYDDRVAVLHKTSDAASPRADHDRGPVAAVEPPPVLADELAIDEWNRIAPSMRAQGRFSPVHQALLVGYCSALAKALRAEEILAVEGPYYQSLGSNGTIVRRRHPAVQDAEKSWNALRQFARQLGISADRPMAHSAVSGRRAFFK